jgi:hypothetical protein
VIRGTSQKYISDRFTFLCIGFAGHLMSSGESDRITGLGLS